MLLTELNPEILVRFRTLCKAESEQNRCATALAGHRAAILFNLNLARAMRLEGNIRSKVGLDKTAPLASKVYATKEKAKVIVEDTSKQIVDDSFSITYDFVSPIASDVTCNVIEPFVEGAVDTVVDSVIPLTTEAIHKMIIVSQGKQSFGDAAKDMGKITVNVAVVGGTKKLSEKIIREQLLKSKNPALSDIATKNEVAQIIAVAAIVEESAIKYINGEITGEEFISEVGEKGTMMVAGLIGGQIGSEIGKIAGGLLGNLAIPVVGGAAGAKVGETIGKILGTIITTVACSGIAAYYGTIKHFDDYKLTERQIRRIEREALAEMENQRVEFRRIVETEYKMWDSKIQKGFDQILCCACEEGCNFKGITEGIDTILSIFGEEARFHSIEEYKSQLNQPLTLRF